jgi:6-pyruvoyl-tetrahydropterin synthase
LIFGHKNKSQAKFHVDLGDLQNEKEQLSSFLQSNLKVTVSPFGNQLTVNSENLSAQELQRVVTKFVYHRNFNSTHWASIEGTTVKINRFKETAKKKTDKHKDKTTHQTAAESWGL